MDNETLSALKKSITHWKENLRNLKDKKYSLIKTGVDNCALCQLFWPSCGDCPIQKKVYTRLCRNTPYEEFIAVFRETDNAVCTWEDDTVEYPDMYYEAVELCEKEVNFLISLLPDESNKNV